MSDLTPEALQTRMKRGDIYPLDRAERALGNFFRRGNLIALRELALRQVAQVVDKNLEAHWTREGVEPAVTVREKIAVAISSNPVAQYLIARGGRMAHGIDAEFYVVYVDSLADEDDDNRRSLLENIRFAANVGATVVRLPKGHIAESVADFVRDEHFVD